jgi:hypothetical protein
VKGTIEHSEAALPELINRKRAAVKLGLSIRTVDRLRAEDALESRKTSQRRVMITVGSVAELLRRLNGAEPARDRHEAAADPFAIPALEELRARKAAAAGSDRAEEAA